MATLHQSVSLMDQASYQQAMDNMSPKDLQKCVMEYLRRYHKQRPELAHLIMKAAGSRDSSVHAEEDDDWTDIGGNEDEDDFDENDGVPDEPAQDIPDYSTGEFRQNSSLSNTNSNSSQLSLRRDNGMEKREALDNGMDIGTSPMSTYDSDNSESGNSQPCLRRPSHQIQISPPNGQYSPQITPLTDQLLKIRDLHSQNSVIKEQNSMMKERIQSLIIGQGIETDFVKEEDFAKDKLQPFRQQTYNNLLEEVMEELRDRHEEYESEEDDDNDDDDDDDIETVTKFDLLSDRMASEWLIGILQKCYQSMDRRKERICQIIVEQLKIEENEKQSAEDIAFGLIHPQLQNRWDFYLNHKMENMYNIEVDEFKQEIADIMESEEVKRLDMVKEFKTGIVNYVKKSCELAWIMILTKPRMKWALFDGMFDENAGHELRTGSRTEEDSAQIVFWGFPAVSQAHFSIEGKDILIMKGELFAHHDETLIEYIKSDPE